MQLKEGDIIQLFSGRIVLVEKGLNGKLGYQYPENNRFVNIIPKHFSTKSNTPYSYHR